VEKQEKPRSLEKIKSQRKLEKAEDIKIGLI
jgi:hypothetical protein